MHAAIQVLRIPAQIFMIVWLALSPLSRLVQLETVFGMESVAFSQATNVLVGYPCFAGQWL